MILKGSIPPRNLTKSSNLLLQVSSSRPSGTTIDKQHLTMTSTEYGDEFSTDHCQFVIAVVISVGHDQNHD